MLTARDVTTDSLELLVWQFRGAGAGPIAGVTLATILTPTSTTVSAPPPSTLTARDVVSESLQLLVWQFKS